VTTVIALDSAGPRIGVALLHDGAVAVRLADGGRGTERQLVGLVAELFDEAGVARSAVDAVAVSIGPGAFTGLRVGIATAGGLAQALARPVVPIGSLEPRALHVGLAGELLVMLDARKQRVYAAAWHDTELVRGAVDVSPTEAIAWMSAPFRAAGAGAVVYEEAVRAANGVVVADATHPGVGSGISPTELVPRYLRAPDAVARRGGAGR